MSPPVLDLLRDPPLSTEAKAAFKPTSVVLVGMRGVGKTFLGKAAAATLDWPFIDLDDELVARSGGRSCADVVALEGWAAFRTRETEVLRSVLEAHPHRTVIACGGGIVETPAARDVLSRHPLVVHVERSIDDIAGDLASAAASEGSSVALGTKHRPAYAGGESLQASWKRRRPWFEQVSTHHFAVVPKDSNWRKITADFRAWLACIGAGDVVGSWCEVPARKDVPSVDTLAVRRAPLPMPRLTRPLANGTFFVCLTYPGLATAVDQLPAVCAGVDAVELRVDLLASTEPRFVLQQLALLRRVVKLPVVFTVRSSAHGGNFRGSIDEQRELLLLGVRAGCDYIDVEAHSEAFVASVYRHRGAARIISSVHATTSVLAVSTGRQDLAAMFRQSYCRGLADYVKVVVPCESMTECLLLRSVADEFAAQHADCVVITVGTGESAKLTRVLNRTLTPVTHGLLPSAAASGQLTAEELQRLRIDQGLIPRRRFYLFGHPIRHSPSRVLHSTGFRVLHLPHTYVPVALLFLTDAVCVDGACCYAQV